MFGGEFFQQGGGVFGKVWSYSPAGHHWQQQGEMPIPRHGLGAVTLNDAIYVVGWATELRVYSKPVLRWKEPSLNKKGQQCRPLLFGWLTAA